MPLGYLSARVESGGEAWLEQALPLSMERETVPLAVRARMITIVPRAALIMMGRMVAATTVVTITSR